MSATRVMVFYDGNFFKAGQIHFRYKENRGWFSLPGLHGTLEKYISMKAKNPIELTKVVGAHYYDGRTSTQVADAEHLQRERAFEMALIEAGIVPHYLPVRETLGPKSTAEAPQWLLAQKGVDVHFALDVLDYAHTDRFDVAVLVTGDADFLPLVRKITSIGKQAMIAYFDIEPWVDSMGKSHNRTKCSADLLEAASWSLNFNHLVKDPDWKPDLKILFFHPKEKLPGK